MKRYFVYIFLLFSSLGSVQVSIAQKGEEFPVVPSNPQASPIFGKDIVLHETPGEPQGYVSLCSAYNGWLYATVSSRLSNCERLVILESKDQGMNWEVLMNSTSSPDYEIITKIVTSSTGNNYDSLKLLVGLMLFDTNYSHPRAWLARYNLTPFYGEGEILKQYASTNYDLAISSDLGYPATGSVPNSIMAVYSTLGYSIDSIVCLSSGDGGGLFDSRKIAATTVSHFEKVSVNYGRSDTWNSGRYFVAWDERTSTTAEYGHIYTAHSEPDFNSPFTTPVCLDSLNDDWIGQCRNPVIASQYGSADNDSANLTTVILFETLNTQNGSIDINGAYCLQSVQSFYYVPFTLAGTADEETMPDLKFNPDTYQFMATYANETTQKLPFLVKHMNMPTPNLWQVISPGYNDQPFEISANPVMAFNPVEGTAAMAWISENLPDQGVALFDAVYSTYTSNEGMLTDDPFECVIYPNPTSGKCSISYTIDEKDQVTIDLYNATGQLLFHEVYQHNTSGTYTHDLNLSFLNQGMYLLSFSCKDGKQIKKIQIIH